MFIYADFLASHSVTALGSPKSRRPTGISKVPVGAHLRSAGPSNCANMDDTPTINPISYSLWMILEDKLRAIRLQCDLASHFVLKSLLYNVESGAENLGSQDVAAAAVSGRARGRDGLVHTHTWAHLTPRNVALPETSDCVSSLERWVNVTLPPTNLSQAMLPLGTAFRITSTECLLTPITPYAVYFIRQRNSEIALLFLCFVGFQYSPTYVTKYCVNLLVIHRLYRTGWLGNINDRYNLVIPTVCKETVLYPETVCILHGSSLHFHIRIADKKYNLNTVCFEYKSAREEEELRHGKNASRILNSANMGSVSELHAYKPHCTVVPYTLPDYSHIDDNGGIKLSVA
ncbi:hypothetical protein J6590_003434 [Homalodisca vitripennis]|nr:hypothetical protein J6590_003434 [Homalodisca vitripennis]